MGYYSKVTMIVTSDMAKLMDTIIHDEPYSQPSCISKDTKNDVVRYEWDWIKWNGNCKFIEKINELCGNVQDFEGGSEDEKYKDMAYVFLRDGESDDDVYFERGNVEGTPLEDCWCNSVITCDGLHFDDEPTDTTTLSYEQKAYICDKLCKHCHMLSQEELDEMCEKCPIN